MVQPPPVVAGSVITRRPGVDLGRKPGRPSPNTWSQDGQQAGAYCPFEATVARSAPRLAELKLERLAHEADKPKRQEAANVDAAEHGPWRLSDPRLHAREQA
jgi:hypothetical protein